MEPIEIQRLLQLYFNGESSKEEERELEKYFSAGDVDDEFSEYAEFFGGISELSHGNEGTAIEEDVMNFILEHEHAEKTKYRGLWKTVTGIAASIIVVLGSLLIYEQQQKPFTDTFKNPEDAYAYAQKTLLFMSGKYETGLAPLSKTKIYNEALAELNQLDKLNITSKPFSKSVKTIRKGLEITEINE